MNGRCLPMPQERHPAISCCAAAAMLAAARTLRALGADDHQRRVAVRLRFGSASQQVAYTQRARVIVR